MQGTDPPKILPGRLVKLVVVWRKSAAVAARCSALEGLQNDIAKIDKQAGRIELLTGLAFGADIEAAEVAVEMGIALHVMLPAQVKRVALFASPWGITKGLHVITMPTCKYFAPLMCSWLFGMGKALRKSEARARSSKNPCV